MMVDVQTLRKAVAIYLHIAYPNGGIPPAVQERIACLERLAPHEPLPKACMEVSCTTAGRTTYMLRLGQPRYPHMKLVLEDAPDGGQLFRADAHDAHLHAPPGSPDAAPLAALRASNKELTEAIEAAWTSQGLPTFREYLRKQLERRRAH